MKNIHVLSTEKPSRLFNCFGKLEIGDYTTIRENLQVTNQHIYITNDEEITGFENNIWVIKADRIFLWQNTMALVSNNKPRKIILTTDQDLIKDGIQAIDDEFLEWFVENPSCKEVEVEEIDSKIPKKEVDGYFSNETLLGYKIIIPKEEPKQETHICKYCNAETTQSDDECYAKPKQETQGYICPHTKIQCDDECCVSAENCHIEESLSILSEPEQKYETERMYSEGDIMNALHSVEVKHNKDYSKIWNSVKEFLNNLKK